MKPFLISILLVSLIAPNLHAREDIRSWYDNSFDMDYIRVDTKRENGMDYVAFSWCAEYERQRSLNRPHPTDYCYQVGRNRQWHPKVELEKLSSEINWRLLGLGAKLFPIAIVGGGVGMVGGLFLSGGNFVAAIAGAGIVGTGVFILGVKASGLEDQHKVKSAFTNEALADRDVTGPPEVMVWQLAKLMATVLDGLEYCNDSSGREVICP